MGLQEELMIFNEAVNNGYVQKRRNLLPHLTTGRMSIQEYLVYDILLQLANTSTGAVTATNLAIWQALGSDTKIMPEWKVKTCMWTLMRKGYIARDRQRGQRGVHKIFINKFLLTTGPGAGELLVFTPVIGDLQPRKNATNMVQNATPVVGLVAAPLATPLATPEDDDPTYMYASRYETDEA